MASSMENFRQNVRRIRKQYQRNEEGWSQADLAERVGVHRNYIGMLERGERQPALDTVDEIASVLDVEPYELIMPSEESF